MYKIGLAQTDNLTVIVGTMESIGPITAFEINEWMKHSMAQGNQHVKKASVMAITNLKLIRLLLGLAMSDVFDNDDTFSSFA